MFGKSHPSPTWALTFKHSLGMAVLLHRTLTPFGREHTYLLTLFVAGNFYHGVSRICSSFVLFGTYSSSYLQYPGFGFYSRFLPYQAHKVGHDQMQYT